MYLWKFILCFIKNNKDNEECLNYIYECILKLQNLEKSFNENNNQIGLKTVTSFNLGIIPTDFIFGKKLILKGIEHPEPSVIERLNPILESPRHLILTEDIQEIFNDDKIFQNIYKKTNKKSIPLNQDFSIFFTSREVFHGRLSEAFLSRCTLIYCPNYDCENYLTMEFKPQENYKIIYKSIVWNEYLEEEIIKFNTILMKIKKIEVLQFIRWCKTVKNIYKKLKGYEYTINNKYLIGISALKSFIDRFDSKQRENIMIKYFKEYLPEKMFNLLTSEFNDKLGECPLELIKINNKQFISSKLSGIILKFPDSENINEDSFKDIEWTKSTIDIADAILVALVSKTILVLEWPPGRGKTAISKAIFNYLNIDNENLKRINFSPSTTVEGVFSRIIPKIDGEKVSAQRKEQGLLSFWQKVVIQLIIIKKE